MRYTAIIAACLLAGCATHGNEPTYVDWSGRRVPAPVSKARVSDSERNRIGEVFQEVAARDRAKADRDGASRAFLSYCFQVRPDGSVLFWPQTSDDWARQIDSDPELEVEVKRRCLDIKAVLKKRGIKAYSSSRWQYLIAVCGEDAQPEN